MHMYVTENYSSKHVMRTNVTQILEALADPIFHK